MFNPVLRRSKLLTIAFEIIIGLFILLWIYTGLNKIIDFANFKVQLGRSPFIQHWTSFIAIALPIGEIILAILLIIKKTRLIGLYLSFSLMALFTGYVYIMLTYSYDLPCSCGGVLEKLSWEDHLIFNALFTVLGIAGIFLQVNRSKFSNRKFEKVIPSQKDIARI
ncbi:MauE/DoxX family redox-associated membrane protein [Chitinophaga niabensis]|uniref:MauE/DoxX family redox-associated membrane protein n=1 Tax=Chitinophaga niabensis TaxID=536979 RepID=UPI0031BA6D5F